MRYILTFICNILMVSFAIIMIVFGLWLGWTIVHAIPLGFSVLFVIYLLYRHHIGTKD